MYKPQFNTSAREPTRNCKECFWRMSYWVSNCRSNRKEKSQRWSIWRLY